MVITDSAAPSASQLNFDETLPRCSWASVSPAMAHYHDTEWGFPQSDDRVLFEQLLLVTFQGGLSWEVILKKRENLRRAFAAFDAEAVAGFAHEDLQRLLCDPGMIRNRTKIEAAIRNAGRFLDVKGQFGTFADYIWRFTDHMVVRTGGTADGPVVRTTSKESDEMACDMRQRGFRYIGSITCYAYMQSIGMIDDHERCCFRHFARQQ